MAKMRTNRRNNLRVQRRRIPKMDAFMRALAKNLGMTVYDMPLVPRPIAANRVIFDKYTGES